MKFFSEFSNPKIRWFALSGAFLLLFLFLMTAHEPMRQPIPRFFTVRAEASAARAFADALDRRHLASYNPYRQKIDFNNYGSTETVSVADLSSRFVEGDLRLDPFMQALRRFFYDLTPEGEPAAVFFYLPADRPAFFLFVQLWAVFGSLNGWQLWGWSTLCFFVFALLFLVSLFFFVMAFKKTPRFSLLFAGLSGVQLLLWLTGSLFFYAYGLWAAFWVYAFARHGEVRWRQRVRYSLAYRPAERQRLRLLAFLFAAPVIALGPLISFRFIGVLLFDLFLLFLQAMQEVQNETRPGYSGFWVEPLAPVSFLGEEEEELPAAAGGNKGKKRGAFSFRKQPGGFSVFGRGSADTGGRRSAGFRRLWGAACFLLPLLAVFSGNDRTPAVFREGSLRWKSVQKAEAALTENRYPHLPGLYAHHSYQRRFMQGLSYNEALQGQWAPTDFFQSDYQLKNRQVTLSKHRIPIYLTDGERNRLYRSDAFYSLLGSPNRFFLYGNHSGAYRLFFIIQYLGWWVALSLSMLLLPYFLRRPFPVKPFSLRAGRHKTIENHPKRV